MQQIIGKVSGLFRAQPRRTAFDPAAADATMRDLIQRETPRGAQDDHVIETTSALGEEPAPAGAADVFAAAPVFERQVFERPVKADHAAPETLSAPDASPRAGPRQTTPIIPADLLDEVGRENETLRHRCEEIVRKVEDAATLRQDLSAVFGHVDTILKDLERTKASLAQRSGAFSAEREAHGELKARHRALLSEHERTRDELQAVQSDKQRHADLLADLDAKAASLQAALGEKTALSGELTRRANADRDHLAQLQSEAQAARDEMQRADELMFSMQADLSAARDHTTLVEEDNKMLQAGLAESRQQNQRLARAQDDMKAAFDAARQRIEELETSLSIERNDHGKLRGLFQQENQSRRGDVSTLQTRLDTLTARVEASDRMLIEARGQLLAKIEEARKAERRAQEAQKTAAPLEGRVRAAEQENEELRARIAETEASHGALGEHAEGLGKSVRAKDKEAAALRAKIEALSERFHNEATRAEAEREHLEQTIGRLAENLEKEKLERSLAEGALEAARKDRQLQQSALSTLRSVQGGRGAPPPMREDEASAA